MPLGGRVAGDPAQPAWKGTGSLAGQERGPVGIYRDIYSCAHAPEVVCVPVWLWTCICGLMEGAGAAGHSLPSLPTPYEYRIKRATRALQGLKVLVTEGFYARQRECLNTVHTVSARHGANGGDAAELLCTGTSSATSRTSCHSFFGSLFSPGQRYREPALRGGTVSCAGRCT